MNLKVALVFCFILGGNFAYGQSLIDGQEQIWSYSQSVTDDREWTSLEYDDSSWQHGTSPLGFGDPDIATVVYTPKQSGEVPTTTYFRASFQVQDSQRLTGLAIKIRLDDGCVVFLNGKEVLRLNLPPERIDAGTFAVQRIEGLDEKLHRQFEIPSDHALEGDNVLAVEVHQPGNGSSDLIMDLALAGLTDSVPNRAHVRELAKHVTMLYSHQHTIAEDVFIPDGFLDGGRGMQVDEFGFAVSGREIIKVDRRIDRELNRHLAWAASDELSQLNTVDRATRIARYIDRLYTPAEGRGVCVPLSEILVRRFASREVLIGDISDFCSAGVCRHRSVLFKLMADEAKIKAKLVRGNYGTAEESGGHAWNEVTLDDGTTAIVDVMNPQPDFYFPHVGERSLRRYFTVAMTPKYTVD